MNLRKKREIDNSPLLFIMQIASSSAGILILLVHYSSLFILVPVHGNKGMEVWRLPGDKEEHCFHPSESLFLNYTDATEEINMEK